MSDETTQLSDRERDIFLELCDLIIPDDFHVLNYTKEKAVKAIMKAVEDDIAIIRLKLRKVKKIFERLQNDDEPADEGDLSFK